MYSEKFCPFIHSEWLYKNGHDFVDGQYIVWEYTGDVKVGLEMCNRS